MARIGRIAEFFGLFFSFLMVRGTSVVTLGALLATAGTQQALTPEFDAAQLNTDQLITASISQASFTSDAAQPTFDQLFQHGAFVGPNSLDKRDRLLPEFDLMAVAEEFNQARIRLAALAAAGPQDPTLQQSVIGVQTDLPVPDEEPRISVASLNTPVSSSALEAIEGVSAVDPRIPLPVTMSEQLAYARDAAPSTERLAHRYSERERWCLATAVYFEARGESYRGQAAVAQVVLNRVRHSVYPSTICGVVYQNASWRNRCQFSFACDGIPERVTERQAWATAEEIADKVSDGALYIPEVGNATHYHATYVYPHWAPRLVRMTKIGLHIFYRFRA